MWFHGDMVNERCGRGACVKRGHLVPSGQSVNDRFGRCHALTLTGVWFRSSRKRDPASDAGLTMSGACSDVVIATDILSGSYAMSQRSNTNTTTSMLSHR